MIHLNCPQCQKRYRLDDALAGRTVRCRECNTSFPVVAADPNAAADSLVEDLVDAEVVEAELKAKFLRSVCPVIHDSVGVPQTCDKGGDMSRNFGE